MRRSKDELPEGDERAVIAHMKGQLSTRGRQLLWFDENGDSYAFFVVEPAVAEQLNDVKLDSDHRFELTPKI